MPTSTATPHHHRHSARLAGVAAAVGCTVIALAGCGDEERSVPDVLLQRDDLPPVDSVDLHEARIGTRPYCGALAGVESNLAITRPSAQGVWYTLDDGDTVVSVVVGVQIGAASIDETLERVGELVDECVGRDGAETTRVEGLPPRAVGWHDRTETSHGPETTERAYGRVDDDSIAVVTVRHDGDGAAEVTAAELLPKAIERAAGSD